MSKSLFKSTIVVASMTLISRIFGFIRDMVTAQVFGAGVAFDAFSVAFKIPNFMRRLFAEGSFSQAFVPVLSEYQKKESLEEVRRFVGAMAGTLSVVLFFVTVMGVVFAPWIIRLFAPGFDTAGPRYELAVTLLRITFPYLWLISLTAFSGAILNTYSRFWVAALTPVLLNISMIGAAIWLAPKLSVPIIGLAWGVFIAGVLQLLFQLPFLKRMQLLPKPRIHFRDPGVMRVLKLMVPALFGVSVSQVNLLIDTLFASFLMVGSVSWLYYSDRLMEFPLGVFGVAISTVILPNLSKHFAMQSKDDFSETLDWAIRCVLIVGLPAAVVLAVMSGPLLSTLFQHGRFSAYSVDMASRSLAMFAIGIAPFMLIKILAAGFYARQNMRTPVRIGVVAMIANIVFNVLLIAPFAHAGIALATSLASLVNMGLLYYFLRKEMIYRPRAGGFYFGCRLLAVNGLLGLLLWFGVGDLVVWTSHAALWRVLHLSYWLLAAVVAYFAMLWLFGVRLRDVWIPERHAIQ